MARRNYTMTRRADAVEETRRRIVEATLVLHAEQGVSNTSWEEIAKRASVGVGTVYRHFPSFDELLSACGDLTWQKLNLPGVEILNGVENRGERLRRIAEAMFALYERGEAELENIRRERAFHPALAEAHRRVEAALDELVRTAVDKAHELVRGMTDLGTWQSLRDQGVAEPATTVANMLECALRTQPGGSSDAKSD